jgi:hypothetical protein
MMIFDIPLTYIATMNKDEFYCVAVADQQRSDVGATVVLPTLLDSTKYRYDISLIFCSFVPTWDTLTDMWLTVNNIKKSAEKSTKEEPKDEVSEVSPTTRVPTIIFENLAFLEPKHILREVQNQLAEQFGESMDKGTPVKLMEDTANKGLWILKVNKNTKVEMSTTMAALFGQNQLLSNDTNDVVKFVVRPKSYPNRALEDVYYVTCDQMISNCVSYYGGIGKVLDVVHLPTSWQNRLVEHRSFDRSYHPIIDDILHSRLDIRLISRDGSPISQKNPEFYALIHVRRQWKNDART